MRIFLDLEMNGISKQYSDMRKICGREVIEFGAVKINDEYAQIDSFRSYVKPQYNDRIDRFITNLTGIKDADVEGAECFAHVLDAFVEWCGTDYEIYSWSLNDLTQLVGEMEQKRIMVTEQFSYMSSHWNDLQQQYGEQLGISKLTKLSEAVWLAGLGFQGRAHTALADAIATADIYREMQKGSLRVVADELNEAKESIGTNLGNLLSFSLG